MGTPFLHDAHRRRTDETAKQSAQCIDEQVVHIAAAVQRVLDDLDQKAVAKNNEQRLPPPDFFKIPSQKKRKRQKDKQIGRKVQHHFQPVKRMQTFACSMANCSRSVLNGTRL